MHFHKDGNGFLDNKFNRRQLLTLGVFASILHCASPALASLRYKRYKLPWYKKLSLYNIHTGESLKTVYWSEGEYITEALYDINFIMRDHRTNDTIPIAPRLLDLLYDIFIELDTKQPIHIISGYRTVKTNNLLRKYSYGVDKNSLHIAGKAVDIRVPQKRLSEVRKVAIDQKSGGVGFYPQSNFVHIDVGTIRYW